MSVGIWQVVVVVILVVLIFGTKKLRHLGEDLGAAIKGFKKGMREGDAIDEAVEKKHIEDTQDKENK